MVKLILRKLGVIPKQTEKLKNPTNFPYYLLRIENAAILLISLYLYFFVLKSSWLLFILLILAPDLSLFAYLLGTKWGGIIYDLFHTYTITVIFLAIALFFRLPLAINISLIWFAHIAQDRLRGFGFKYLNKFEGSHLHNI